MGSTLWALQAHLLAERDNSVVSRADVAWSQAHTECAILCGGRGRRLGGVDKGQITLRGEQLLTKLTRTGLALSSRVMWVRSASKRVDHAISHLMSSDLRVREVSDDPKVDGVLGAVSAALNESEREWVWILACDLPLIEAEHLTPLIKRAQTADSSISCVAYRDPDSSRSAPLIHPLCALWRAGRADKLIRSIQEHRGGLGAYIRREGALIPHLFSPHSPSPLTNVNEPLELSAVEGLALPSR